MNIGIRINKAISPCYGCLDREIGCHSDCLRYKAYQQECKNNRKSIAINNNSFEAHKRDNISKRLHRKSRGQLC